MKDRKKLGAFGEKCARKYLKNNGYAIVEKNFRCKCGEIDIIAKKNKTLIFFEIKTRRNVNFGYPVEAITKLKQQHIKKTAQIFLLNTNILYENIQIDCIEVYVQNNHIKINHIENIIY